MKKIKELWNSSDNYEKILAIYAILMFSGMCFLLMATFIAPNVWALEDMEVYEDYCNDTSVYSDLNELNVTSSISLNSSGSAYEDFTSFTESDPAGRLTQTSTRSTWTGIDRGDPNTYLYKDYSGSLQSFTLRGKFRLTSIPSSSTTIRLQMVTITEALDDYNDNKAANKIQFGSQIRSWSSINSFNVMIMETYSGSLYYSGDSSNQLYINNDYYYELVKSGTTLTQKIDNDADFSSPITSYSITLHANHNVAYCMIPQSINLAGGLSLSGYFENLDLGLGGGCASNGNLTSVVVFEEGDFEFDSVDYNCTLGDGSIEFRASGDGGLNYGSWMPFSAGYDLFDYVLNGTSMMYQVRLNATSTTPVLYSLRLLYTVDEGEILIDALILGNGFFLAAIIQVIISLYSFKIGTWSMFFVGILNIFSALYYFSVIDVSSIKMWGVLFIALMGIYMMGTGWSGKPRRKQNY